MSASADLAAGDTHQGKDGADDHKDDANGPDDGDLGDEADDEQEAEPINSSSPDIG